MRSMVIIVLHYVKEHNVEIVCILTRRHCYNCMFSSVPGGRLYMLSADICSQFWHIQLFNSYEKAHDVIN